MNVQSTKLLFFLVFIFSTLVAKNQIVSDERLVDWKSAHQSFEFEYPELEINILDYGAVGDGKTDDSQVIADAILSLEENGGTIFFPSGEYLLRTGISLGKKVVLRGNSSDSSILIFDLGEGPVNCIAISKSQSTEFRSIDSGILKGSTKLLCSSAEDFNEAKFGEIVQDNGAWDIVPADWAQNSVGQIIRIEGVSGDTIIFNNPLRIDYSQDLNPRIRPIYPIENCAIECLKIKRLDEAIEGPGSNIYFNYAANCMVKGVESDSSVGSHISVNYSTNIKLTGNYIHHAHTYDGAGTRGYGISLSQHSGECYVANNIFRHLRHAMMIKTGSNGNIFAYNYSIEPIRTEPIPDLSGDISFHGHYAFSNLFEGNIVQNIIIDHYWGPSGPFNTLLRNRAELFGILMTSNEESETGFQNIIGNETINTQTPYGQYVITGENHFQYGNNIQGAIVPADTDSLSDTSYYLTDKPVFWTNNINWPPIGIPNELGENINPAKQRYLLGEQLTVCTDTITSGLLEKKFPNKLFVWPNPAVNTLKIKTNYSGRQTIQITDLNGRQLLSKEVFSSNNIIEFDLSFLQKSGLYFIMLKNKNELRTAKLMFNTK